MTDSDNQQVLSVRDLVHSRLHEADGAPLALVQRDEKWDPVRMRHLLDSVLAGYPIGAVLFCRVAQASEVIDRTSSTTRTVRGARPDEWQLLDGQQRINAFFSMLTDRGNPDYGRFFLHMTMTRLDPGPAQSRKTKDRLLKYIAWCPSADDPLDDRHLHVDLSRWTAWADRQADELTISPGNVRELLHQLDPDFATDLPEPAAATACRRLTALWGAWTRKGIPALYAEVQTPNDVLEIFTRVNLGGVDVVSTDVFFAAVKTYWSNAEARLDAVLSAAPFLKNRLSALRLMSRLASRAISPNDLMPLKVDRLAGARPHPLIAAMEELTTEGSDALLRITAFSTWYRAESRLGFSLRLVQPDLWDELLGWAATCPEPSPEWYQDSLEALDSYLLGATIFRYPTVMRDPYKHAALLEALTAGSRSQPFPLDQILAVARRSGLRGSRSLVATLQEAEHRQLHPWNDGSLLTALAQQIPYDPDLPIDWDHIFPQAQAARMWSPGNGRRRHHPRRSYVNAAGNFWALNYSANRALKDLPGEAKFKKLNEWLANEDGYEVWPRERWSLTDEEIATHIEVDRLLDDDASHIEEAMTNFEAVVTGRTKRLWDEALARFPGVRDFALDSEVLAHDSSPAEPFWSSLGLKQPQSTRAAGGSGGPSTSPLGPGWRGREQWPEWILGDVARSAKVNSGDRNKSAKPGDGFLKGWWLWAGAPGRETRFGVGIAPDRMTGDAGPIWAQLHSRWAGWEVVEARLLASELADIAVTEVDPIDPTRSAIWIPLLGASSQGAYQQIMAQVESRLIQVRDIVRGEF